MIKLMIKRKIEPEQTFQTLSKLIVQNLENHFVIEETNFAPSVYYLTFWIDKKSVLLMKQQNKQQTWNMVYVLNKDFDLHTQFLSD